MPDARAKRLRVYYALPRRYPWHSNADDNITRDENEIGPGNLALAEQCARSILS